MIISLYCHNLLLNSVIYLFISVQQNITILLFPDCRGELPYFSQMFVVSFLFLCFILLWGLYYLKCKKKMCSQILDHFVLSVNGIRIYYSLLSFLFCRCCSFTILSFFVFAMLFVTADYQPYPKQWLYPVPMEVWCTEPPECNFWVTLFLLFLTG